MAVGGLVAAAAGSRLAAAAQSGRPCFIDTDTASDDAVALMMAFAEPSISIVGISTVAGNVPIDQATWNAIFVRELYRSSAPIHKGAAGPLTRPLQTGQFAHGQDGMGDIGLPIKQKSADSSDAVGALIDAAARFAGSLELITLGPLTNIAVAISRAPQIVPQIKRCVIMGGVSDYRGNITPVSEYNLWVDPEAAEIVFNSGLRIEMVGWDISRKYAVIDETEAAAIRAIGSERARVAIDCQRKLKDFIEKSSGLPGFDLADPIAMAVALNPAIVTRSKTAVGTIIAGDGPTRGMVMFDQTRRNPDGPRFAVVEEVRRDVFLAMLNEALKS